MHLVRYFEDGFRVGLLAKEGTVHNHIVTVGVPIDVVKRPADDDTAFEYLGGDVEAARRRFLAMGEKLGITERAKRLLQGNNHG